MTNNFKIGDKVREANHQPSWGQYTLEIVAVPDGKKKRYTVLVTYPNGGTRTKHYSENGLAAA